MSRGGILFSVHTDDSEWTRRAKQLLEECGAKQISSSMEARASLPTSHPAHL